MSASLSWSAHYDYISSGAYKTLGLLRRSFSKYNSVQAKKLLYLLLVRSKITYCSPVWRPHLVEDVIALENIQRRATKFILNDFHSNYKSRLISLHILPRIMQFELNDIFFFLKCIKDPTSSFDVSQYVCFSNTFTRSSVIINLHILSPEPSPQATFTLIVSLTSGTLFPPSILAIPLPPSSSH